MGAPTKPDALRFGVYHAIRAGGPGYPNGHQTEFG